jgi:hypothetical protein
MVHVLKADEASLLQVAEHMRHEDIQETEAATGRAPHESLLLSLSLPGEVYVAYLGEEGLSRSRRPFAAFGCSDGRVWLLCTDEVYQARVSTFREAKRHIRVWLEQYGVLYNFADCRNTLHLSWIKALGFTFGEKVEHRGFLFQHFFMEKAHV